MRLPHFVASAAVALLVVSTHSYAEPRPAAPQVTMGADLKLLRFDWEPVAGATFYRLWIKPGGSRYIAVGKRIPASITHTEHAIAVHLQDWVRTRYVVTACNSGGCSHSAALNPRNLVLETIGYLKASNTDPFDFFGHDVVVSDDGRTLAVSAQHESSAATGVNGDQADNSSLYSGAVYIFRRSDAGWRQDAYSQVSPPGHPVLRNRGADESTRDCVERRWLYRRDRRVLAKRGRGRGRGRSVRFPSRRRPLEPGRDATRTRASVRRLLRILRRHVPGWEHDQGELAASGHHRGPS